MMKRIKIIYAFAVSVALMLAACSEEETMEQRGGQTADGLVKVHLRVSPAKTTASTRAWVDDNAEDDEMMNVWTVVAVNTDDNAPIFARADIAVHADLQEVLAQLEQRRLPYAEH